MVVNNRAANEKPRLLALVFVVGVCGFFVLFLLLLLLVVVVVVVVFVVGCWCLCLFVVGCWLFFVVPCCFLLLVVGYLL